MFGNNKIFGKKANEEGVQFDFSASEEATEATETTEETQEETLIDLSTEETNTEETTEETVEESTGTEIEEAEETEETEETSSLNTEETETSTVEETVTETTEVVTPEVTEEMILKSLSEKLGRDVTSFDDLTPADPLAGNEYVKGLLEWQNKTGRPIEDYVKYQKDYSQVADIDIAREFLQIKYPTFTNDEIQFELERNFIAGEDDLESEIKVKSIDLKKFAAEGRSELDKLRMDLGKPNPQAFTAEVQEQLDFAKQVQAQIKANQEAQTKYTTDATKAVGMVENIELPLAEGVKLDFKVETSKEALTDMVLNSSQWKDDNGNVDHLAVARDAAKLANFDAMLKLAYEQGLAAGTDEVIKEAKNTTIDSTIKNAAEVQSGKGMVVEGLDNYLGKKGMSIRRFSKK